MDNPKNNQRDMNTTNDNENLAASDLSDAAGYTRDRHGNRCVDGDRVRCWGELRCQDGFKVVANGEEVTLRVKRSSRGTYWQAGMIPLLDFAQKIEKV